MRFMPRGIACPGWGTDGRSCRWLQGAPTSAPQAARPAPLAADWLPSIMQPPWSILVGARPNGPGRPPFAVFRTAVLEATPRHAPLKLVEEARLGLNRPGLRRPWD